MSQFNLDQFNSFVNSSGAPSGMISAMKGLGSKISSQLNYSPYSQRGVRDTMVNRSNELFDQNSGYNRQLRQNIARQGRQVGMGGLLGATLSAQGMGEAGANLVAGQRMRAINADNQANNLNAFNQAYGANQQLAQGYLQQAGAANASILQNDVEMERLKNEREARKFGVGDIFGGILGAGVGALTGGLGAGLAGGLTDSWFGGSTSKGSSGSSGYGGYDGRVVDPYANPFRLPWEN